MKILLSNDDGYLAPGLRVLIDVFAQEHEVIVVAPDSERSASSHCITLNKPIRVRKITDSPNITIFSCDGTPADCVKLAFDSILDSPPDLVISGINPGPNLGIDTRYSGTVAAAFEGVQQNVPSFAVSLGSNKGPFHFEKAATFAKDVICMILRSDFEFAGTLINLNIPNSEKIRGLKVTRLNNNIYRDVFEKREDPRGRPYYWMVGGLDNHDQDPACDLEAIKAGFASVTPLRLDQTRHHKLEALAKTVSSEYKIKGHL